MKPSTELFSLIKSLSKSEKRFFKLSSSLQSGDKNYLKIFDFIESQSSYNEEELKANFKGERFVKHLPSEKNHLYKLVLKSLRAYYSEQTVSSILKQEIKNVEILYNKALYRECEKFVARAKKLSQEYEKFYYWLELISWEKKLQEVAYEEGQFSVDLDALIAEEEEVISKLRNLAEYQVLYSKINSIFRSEGFTRNEEEEKVVNDIADYHLIKGKNTALSTRAATICYYVKGLCSATSRDYPSSFLFFNKVREILDRSNLLEDDLGKRYVLTLSHLIHCYIDNKDFKNAFEIIKQLRDLEGKKGFESLDIKLRIFTVTSITELNILNNLGDFDKAVELLPNFQTQFDVMDDKMSKEQKITFIYEKAYSYFGIGEYKASLHYLNEVLNDNENALRQDIYTYARLLNLIIHFELKNYDFLTYVIKSTSRFINKTKRNYEIEGYLIKQLKSLAKENSEEKKLNIFLEMKEKTTILFQDPNEQVMLEFFDISSWIDSKIVSIPFADAVKNNAKLESKSNR